MDDNATSSQPSLVVHAAALAKRIVEEAEKLGHETLGEIEKMLHLKTQPATPPAASGAPQPVASATPAQQS